MRIGSTLFLLGQKLKMAKNCCKQVKKEKYSKIQQKTKDVLSELEHIQFALLTCPDSNLLCEEFQAQKHGLSLPEFMAFLFELKSRFQSRKQTTKDVLSELEHTQYAFLMRPDSVRSFKHINMAFLCLSSGTFFQTKVQISMIIMW